MVMSKNPNQNFDFDKSVYYKKTDLKKKIY